MSLFVLVGNWKLMNYEANLDWSFFNRHMLRSHVHDVRLIDGVDEQVLPETLLHFYLLSRG